MRALTLGLVSLALSLAPALGCASSEADNEEASEDAVTGGTVDEGHPGAGLLTFADGEMVCGGTLVAPNVVLTAAHCLASPPTDFYLGKGVPITIFEKPSKALSKMRRFRIAEIVPFPSFERAKAFAPSGIAASYVCTRDVIDVALIRLAEPVTGVTPVPMGNAPVVGADCEVVGYSTHKYANREFETRYERRVAKRRIREAPPYRIFSRGIDGQTRSGDSGGGLFCDGKVIGVLSCTLPSEDDHSRFDPIRSWVDFQLAKWR